MPDSRVALKTGIVVIGAGQAGLSSAYHIKKLGLTPGRGFVVLDRSPRLGGANLATAGATHIRRAGGR